MMPEHMRLLIADDDLTSRLMLKSILILSGFDVVDVEDGLAAQEIMSQPDAPRLAIIDWMMPGMDGIMLCRNLRKINFKEPPYLIILTARNDNSDVVTGLKSGANDYISKPYDRGELLARIEVGRRMLQLQHELTERVRELESAQAYISTLHGVLPICSHCHKIRTDQSGWEKLERYIAEHSDVQFSHGVCPECMKKYYT